MKPLRPLAFILLFAAIPLNGQQKYTAGQIVFNHPGPYTQTQLEDAVGMHPGVSFTADDLAAAAQRLVDSSFFDDAGASLDGKVDAITVLFDIQPIERTHMLRIGFENFVWLSRAEIDTALHAKSPLFAGYLPETSPLKDVFDAALTDALAAKGIAAKVSHDTIEPTLQRPERTIEFRIATPEVRVANIKLAGVSTELVPLVQKSVNATARSLYSDGLAGRTTEDTILAPLLDAGYVKASLSDVALAPILAGDTASVVLSATLNAGDIYRVASISFAGAPLLSAEAFAATERLHPGDIASRLLLLETLAPLDAAYRRQGYMDVIVKATLAADPATHQVAYTVSVTPGEPYRIHEVTAKNLDDAAQAEFDRGFLMKAGALYSPEYATNFLKSNTALQALQHYSGSFKAYADTNTHTVDLVITFFRGGR
jgi:outer membrane protein insertion porin family